METYTHKNELTDTFTATQVVEGWFAVDHVVEVKSLTWPKRKSHISKNPRFMLDSANMEKLKKGLPYKANPNILAFTPDELDLIRRFGWGYSKRRNGNNLVYRSNDIPIDAVLSGEMELVNVDFSNHLIYNLKGDHLPVGIVFDYIEAALHDGNYDLPKVLKHLQLRDDIEWGNEGAKILEVPYYNASDSRQFYLNFCWGPNSLTYNRLMNSKMDGQRNYVGCHTYKEIRELDMLGIEQFRINDEMVWG